MIDRLASVGQALAESGVQPYTVVHVHHCIDCARHATTTKHVPGSYEKRFREIARAVEVGAQIQLCGPFAFGVLSTDVDGLRTPLFEKFSTAVRPSTI